MYVLVYDISDQKKLRNVAKICENYLTRVQKSVFEGELTKSELFKLYNKLKNEIDSDDSLFIYFIPSSAIKKKIILGKKQEDPFSIF
ncbi:MAG: CRISPR-associated endonuclease Cas2 [Promethearchaeota archaeon]